MTRCIFFTNHNIESSQHVKHIEQCLAYSKSFKKVSFIIHLLSSCMINHGVGICMNLWVLERCLTQSRYSINHGGMDDFIYLPVNYVSLTMIQTPREQKTCLSSSPQYCKGLEQYLTHSKHSTYIC